MHDAEVVDTAAQNVERSTDSLLDIGLQHFGNVAVGTFERDVAPIRADENRSQRTTLGNTPISLDEYVDIIFRTTLFESIIRLLDGGDKSRIVLAVTGQSLDDTVHLHLHHDVHTAFEVEAQIQFVALALLVGEFAEPKVVDRQILHRIEIMLFGSGLLLGRILRGIAGRFLLYAPCLERKRKLINARDRQKRRNEFDETFALHFY